MMMMMMANEQTVQMAQGLEDKISENKNQNEENILLVVRAYLTNKLLNIACVLL